MFLGTPVKGSTLPLDDPTGSRTMRPPVSVGHALERGVLSRVGETDGFVHAEILEEVVNLGHEVGRRTRHTGAELADREGDVRTARTRKVHERAQAHLEGLDEIRKGRLGGRSQREGGGDVSFETRCIWHGTLAEAGRRSDAVREVESKKFLDVLLHVDRDGLVGIATNLHGQQIFELALIHDIPVGSESGDKSMVEGGGIQRVTVLVDRCRVGDLEVVNVHAEEEGFQIGRIIVDVDVLVGVRKTT